MWKKNDNALREIVRDRKRKQYYITNIEIIKDDKNPENVGRIVQYKFGKTIFEFLCNATNPPVLDDADEDEVREAFNPFDLWEGANFILRTHRDPKNNQISYSRSKFQKQSEHHGGDEAKLEAVLEKCVDLKTFVDPSNLQENLLEKVNEAYSLLIETQEPRDFRQPRVNKELPKNDSYDEPEPSRKELEDDLEKWANDEPKKAEPKSIPKKEEPVEENVDEDLEFFKSLCADD